MTPTLQEHRRESSLRLTTHAGRGVACLSGEPVERVECVEDHDAVYDVWNAAGARDRIAVHFDGHLDFEWIADHTADELLTARTSRDLDQLLAKVRIWNLARVPPRSRITIANFFYPAIKEGVVRELIWVVPDPFWSGARARGALIRGLRRKLERRSNDSGPLQVSERAITFRVLGCRVTVCTLSALPALAEPVLVDIDVDYLLTSNPTGRPPYFQPAPVSPWLAPSEFLRRLRSAALRTDLVTIAYSVNGGYTPLRHKYFGDLLRKALSDPSAPIEDAPPAGSAAEAYEEACRALEAGNLELMRAAWEKMVRRDASYRTVYAISGWRDETRGAWRSALETYDRMTQVDPCWHVPHVGRGRALWRFGRYEEAEGAFQRACALSDQPTSAMSWLGSCYVRRGQWEAAHRLWSEAVDEDPSDRRSGFCLAVLDRRRGAATSEKPVRLAHTRDLEWSELDSEVVVLDRALGEVLRLNQVGGFIWSQLDGTQTADEIAARVAARFATDLPNASRDVREFLNTLRSLELVEERRGDR